MIRGINKEIFSGTELKEVLDSEFNNQGYQVKDNSAAVIVTLELKNETDKDINAGMIITQCIECEAYPAGWANGPWCFNKENMLITAGSEAKQELKVCYLLNGTKNESEAGLRYLSTNSYRLVCSVYPVKKYIEIP